MNKLKVLIKNIIFTIYPKKCICCGDIIDENRSLCVKCDSKIERMDLDKICLDCGFEKDDCSCKYNVFRFTAVTCAFKNDGNARAAYYSYKFAKRQHYASFFSNEVANAVKQCYSDVNFDCVCYVPSYNKRAYNHCGYIAREIAKNLDLPFYDDLLLCVKKCKKQHKSSIEERMNNVDGKYLAKYRIDKKNVLLIDDIKTTGATLDECAKTLMFAGAENVYCATVLGGNAKKN